jgi:endonuclease/exonuclease/phosphatase family metal-dependent hydrolase
VNVWGVVLGVATCALCACAPTSDQAPVLADASRDAVGDDALGVAGDVAPDADDVVPDAPTGLDDVTTDTPDRPAGPRAWCAAQWPLNTQVAVGVPTENLYARAWVEGITPSGGDDDQLDVEFALGPVGDHPRGWSGWVAGTHNPACECGNDDEFSARLTAQVPGSSAWAARVRYGSGSWLYCDRADPGREGSNDGWRSEDAPRVEVGQDEELRVVTLNLRCLLDDWDARLPVIVDLLADLEPDLVGFQEVCREPGGRDNLAELTASLAERTGRVYHTRFARSHWSWDQYDEGVGLLSPHRLTDHIAVSLPAGTFERRLLAARAVTPRGPVVIGTTHLDHRESDSRRVQVVVAVEALSALVAEGEAVILTGDFNETPGGAVTQTLAGAGLVDVWDEVGRGAGRTFPASRPRSRIDYIWYLGDAFDAERAEVLFEGPEASDHLGVGAAFR